MRDALSLLDQVLAFGGGRAIESEVRALLGTLDRHHVERIIESLAAGEGATLMQCVAELDERAPDYHQALGELTAALQRMALLQAIPELASGEDAEQDQALVRHAARFTPEELQLLYQIGIMARRDLDFAPDARGGFEMALLRMLSFRPLSPAADGEGSAASARSSGGGRQAEPERPARAAAGKPSAVAARAGAGADTDTDWAGIVSALDLQGPAGQLAGHCLLLDRKPGFVRLGLDASGEVYRRPQLEQKLCDALSAHFGEPVRLEITAGPAEADTPARRQSQAAEQRLRDATRAIDEDPAVRAMRDVFNATVQPGSIKPL